MITNESEIRVALQAILVSVLALYGFWGCAMVVVFILLPWKPLWAVGTYLVQPVVDWRVRKARERHERGMVRIERELDAFLDTPRGHAPITQIAPNAVPRQRMAAPEVARPLGPTGKEALQRPSDPAGATREGKRPSPESPRPLEPLKANAGTAPTRQDVTPAGQNLVATLAIPPAIEDHVRHLPQGVFSNMDLEVEQVKFQGDKAEAYVKFQSPNVRELVIRQRYVLRKAGVQWQVESRQPANGSSHMLPYTLPALKQSMRPA